MDEVVYHKINYQGSSKVIKRLCEESGNLVDYKADKSEIPVNTSDLYNDSGFITNLVDDLANYYLKSETYTQAEVNSLIGAISTLHIEVVQTLPTEDISTNTIYLVPKQTAGQNDTYDEYIYVNNHWEHIGSTDIDLTNYYTKTETDTLLDGKVDKVTGKGLSTEDYTTAEKTKLSGIETGAQVNIKPDWDAAAGADDEILNKPLLATVATTGDYDDLTNKPQNLVQDANYVHTDNNYTTTEKTKLAGIEAGAQVNVEPLIGTTLNTTPLQVLNAIQNGVPVSITHTDATYGAGTVTSFYYSAVNNAVIGSTVAKVYNGGQFVGYLLFELMGHTTANTWIMYNTMLAEKTDIPDELADLGDDPTHRLVTDTEKAAWDGKSEVSANPQSTTGGSLSSIEIDGVGYSISGGGESANAWLNTGGTNLNPASDNLIDLNDYTTPGVYYCSDNSKSQYVSNRPTNNAQVFTLVVQKVGSAVSNWRQIYYEAGATPRMYYRAKNGSSSSWQEWKSEALSSDIPTSWKLTHDTTLIDATSSNPVDLNDIATPGTYHANDGNVAYISNKPALATQTKRFLLVVQNISNTANAYQIYMEGSQSRWFIRNTTNYGSTWSAWAQIAYADKMWRLAEGTQLNATSESRLDLNTIDAAGTYYTPNETSGPYIDHKPVEANNRFTLIVQALGNADSNRVRQIYQSIGTHDIYERYRNGTSANWSSWRRFVYDNEISQPLIGTTATVTPSQVLDALQAGRPIYIAYTETESGANVTLGYSDFTYIDLTGNIYSTLLTSSQGHPVMMALTGNVSTNIWSGYTAVLAEQSDIPAAQVNSDWNANSGVEQILNKPTLAAVATSGSYNDLTNKPTIPAAQVNSDWNASSGLAKILNKPTLATVATSGSYNDLSNKPTIPAAQVNADWNASSGVAQILNKPTIPSPYSLPLAANGTRGGIQIGFTQTGKKYPVQLSSEKAYVEVPWTDNNTTYSAGQGLVLNSTTFKLGSGTVAHYSRTGSGNAYIQISINSTKAWMISFRVRLYGNYICDEYIISGYQYGSNYWYSPNAILTNSDGTARKVIFGYTSANNLWVAIPDRAYTGCDIIDVVNGYTQVDSFDGLFTLTRIAESSLATKQAEVTVNPPIRSVTTGTVGSASAGTAIAADDITAWNAGSIPSASVSNGRLTLSAGSAPSLSYTARSIPNISVTNTTVVTGASRALT